MAPQVVGFILTIANELWMPQSTEKIWFSIHGGSSDFLSLPPVPSQRQPQSQMRKCTDTSSAWFALDYESCYLNF